MTTQPQTTLPTPAQDMKLLKVLSILMDYPSHDLFADDTLAQCKAIVSTSRLISPAVRSEINALVDELIQKGEMEAGSTYDSLFERGRSLSLWLFEHVHGESRDRGQAMVDLMAQYEAAGFEIDAKELPDFLPMYLEFLSYQAAVTGDASDNYRQTRDDLAHISHIVALLGARLQDKGSLYVSLFKALLQIAGEPLTLIEDELANMQLAKVPADDTVEAIDQAWEEEMVDFLGAEQENCPSNQTKKHIATTLAAQAQNTVDVPVHWIDFTAPSQPSSHHPSALSTAVQGEPL